MEFTLLSSVSLTFRNTGRNQDDTMSVKTSTVQVDKLEGSSSGSLPSAHFLTKLENLLLVQGSRESKRQRLSQPLGFRMNVKLFYGALSDAAPNREQTGYLKIIDFRRSDGLLRRLWNVCDGLNNIQARLEMEFGTEEDKMKLNFGFEDMPMRRCFETQIIFAKKFNFSESLSQKWDTESPFTGTLSLALKVNDKALNLIHLGGLGVNDLINRKLLEDAKESGDGIIRVENGKEFPCHKAILSAHSDVFKAMFNSDMKEGKSSRVIMSDMSEGGVKALLAYIYCGDIMDALSSSLVAVELLKTADKYGLDELFETMKDLILTKEDAWFSVDVAVKLFTLVRNRVDSAEFKEMEKKAKLLLKSKPVSELKECPEFCELFDNRDTAIDMWSYFMENQ